MENLAGIHFRGCKSVEGYTKGWRVMRAGMTGARNAGCGREEVDRSILERKSKDKRIWS